MKANLTENVFNPCHLLAGLFLMITPAVNGQNSSGVMASQGLRISIFDIDACIARNADARIHIAQGFIDIQMNGYIGYRF
jgi:hypothetical protein